MFSFLPDSFLTFVINIIRSVSCSCLIFRAYRWFLSWLATVTEPKFCSKRTALQRSNASHFTDDPSSRTRRVLKWQKQPWRTAIRFPSLPPPSIPRKIVTPVWPGGSSGIDDQSCTRYCLPRTATVKTRRCFQKGRMHEKKCYCIYDAG